MAEPLLGILSGFMKGKANRARADRELEQLKEQTRAKVASERVALEKEKRALLQDQQKQKLMDMLLQNLQAAQGGQGETMPKEETTPMGASILDELSRGQIKNEMPYGASFNIPSMPSMSARSPQGAAAKPSGGIAGMNPMMMALMKEATGIDLLGAAGLEQRQTTEQRQASQGAARLGQGAEQLRLSGERIKQGEQSLLQGQQNIDIRREGFERGFSEGNYVDTIGNDGGVIKVWVPKYGGSALRPDLLGKKPEKKMPIVEDDRPFYINPETMQRAPVGMTPEQASKSGFVRIPATQMEKVQKIEAVKSVLAEVELLMNQVIPKQEAIGRLGGLGRKISAEAQITEGGQKLAVLKDYINANRAQVAKALGEVGNLSESEQEAVVKAFGSITDAGPKAWMQFELLKKTFEKAKTVAFGSANKVDFVFNPQTGKLEPAK